MTKLQTIEKKHKEKYEREHKLINGVDHKICNKHHIHFPDEDSWFLATEEYFYHNDKNKTDYLYPYCKKCGIISSGIRNKENPESRKDYNAKYYLNPWRPEISRKSAKKKRERGYYKEYYSRPEVKERKYGSKHRDHDITEAEWIHCKDYFKDNDGDWCCAYCGKKAQNNIIKRYIDGGEKLITIDLHKEHNDDEGANDLRNCLPACQSCNSNKWTFDFEDWYRQQEFFNQDRYDKIIKWTTEDYKLYIENKPPYRVRKKRNEDNNKFHHELWSVDEMRNMVEILATGVKKKDLDIHIKELFPTL